MKDKLLIRISLIWSVLGILFLLLVAEYSEPSRINIIEAEGNIGKIVVIVGEINSFSSKPTVTFIDVKDKTGEISVVSFDKLQRPSCSSIEVTGKIDVYKGDLEIVADKIKCL